GLYRTKLTPSENISRMFSWPETTATARGESFRREERLSPNKPTTSACVSQSRMSRSKRSCATLTAARTASGHNSTRIPSSSSTRFSTCTEASSAHTSRDERVIPAIILGSPQFLRQVTAVIPAVPVFRGSSLNSSAVNRCDLSHPQHYKRPIVFRCTVVL